MPEPGRIIFAGLVRHSKALLVLFAVSAALTGGAQALVPTVAPAFQTDGCSEWNAAGECTYLNEGPGQGDSWETQSKSNGAGAGADNGFGEDWSQKDDGNNTYSHDFDVGWKLPQPSAEEKKITTG